MFKSPARITLGVITQVAVAISSGVSPEVGITTSPILLKYFLSTIQLVFRFISVVTSLYVV